MFKIFFKILGCLILANCVIQLLWALVTLRSPAWGDEVANLKYEYYQNNIEKYDTLFIGSSRIYRHIKPVIFDSEKYGFETRSFNMGALGFYGEKILPLVEHILEKNKNLPKTIFCEFDFGNMPDNNNLHHIGRYFPYDLSVSLKMINSLQDENLNRFEKMKYAYRHLVNYSDNLFKIGAGYGILSSLVGKNPLGKKKSVEYLGRNKDGYYSLDDNMADETGHEICELHQSPKLLENCIKISTDAWQYALKKNHVNRFFLSTFNTIIRSAEDKGVKVVFVLTPRRKKDYEYFLPVFKLLPPKNKIQLANPKEFPEFYQEALSFDFGHLNDKGAGIFTNKLCEKFSQIYK